MAFCTSCGATVNGAFCNQCGTPAAGRTAAAPPPPGPAPVPPPVATGPVQAKRGLSPVAWVLIVLGCVVALVVVAAVGTGFFLVNKARQAGIDPELLRTNPGMAFAKMVTALDPNMEVVSANTGSGTITLRDRRNGKEVTMSIEDVKRGRVRISADDDNGKTAMVEIGGSGKLPSWVPEYPNAGDSKPVFAVRGDSGENSGEAGSVTFTTPDSVEKVVAFYQTKAEEMGMQVELKAVSSRGGTVIGKDEPGQRTLTAIVSEGGPTTVQVTYARKR